MLFKAQIRFSPKLSADKKKCTLVFETHDAETAPTALRSIASAWFSANTDTLEILELNGLADGFLVIGRYPS